MMVPLSVMVPLTWALLAWVLFPFESSSFCLLNLRDSDTQLLRWVPTVNKAVLLIVLLLR